MSKELTPLEALNKVVYCYGYDKNIEIIETALKNYEELTNKPVILYGRTHEKSQALIDTICANYKVVRIVNLEDEKKLKALEEIKKVKGLIEEEDFCEYNGKYYFFAGEVDKETYDLLKEVLL